MAIDWTKPIETVPDALNPEPVRCEFLRFDSDGDAVARLTAPWINAAGDDKSDDFGWYFEATHGDPHTSFLPTLRNVAEGVSTEDTLLPDAPPVVLNEAPILLRYHLAQAAMLYEVVDKDTPVGDLVRGLGEPAREAATAWLAAMLAFYDKLDAEEQDQ